MAKFNERVEEVENHIMQLYQWWQELNADQVELRATVKQEMSEMNQKLEHLFRKLEDIERIITASNPHNSPRVRNETGNSNSIPIQKPTEISPNLNDRRPTIEFPRFSGENPRSWFRKCRKYFRFFPMAENEKVLLASMYMEDKAEFFYVDYIEGKEDIGWERFSEMVLERFGDPCGKNVIGAFIKLQQEGSVEMYVGEFEELKAFMVQMNRTLTEEHLVMCFLNGLKEEIRNVVEMLSPATLTRAIELARIQETLLENSIKKSPQEEMNQREKERLCLNCDKPDSYGQKCKKSYEEKEEEEEVEVQERSCEVEEDSKASIYSLILPNSPYTIVLKGVVEKGSISIKLVSGSTHSFLDPQAARRVGCQIECTNHFLVTLGNGREIECNSKCSGFEWQMGGVTFTADVRIMELGWYGCDGAWSGFLE